MPFLSIFLQDKQMHRYQNILVRLCPLLIFALSALDIAAKAQSLPSQSPTLLTAVPRLKGIFLSLYSIDSFYDAAQWEKEFAAMAKLGIEFVGVRAALQGTSNETQGGCTLGRYKAMYPTTLTPETCYQNNMKSKKHFSICTGCRKEVQCESSCDAYDATYTICLATHTESRILRFLDRVAG